MLDPVKEAVAATLPETGETESASSSTFGPNSEAVRAHLQFLQSAISRMALDSAAAKTWCITIVSAILIFVADKNKAEFAYIALVPAVFFCVLDGYYLGLEKRFIKAYNEFVDKVHGGKVKLADIYVVRPKGDPAESLKAAFLSFAVWPFYATLITMILLTRSLII